MQKVDLSLKYFLRISFLTTFAIGSVDSHLLINR